MNVKFAAWLLYTLRVTMPLLGLVCFFISNTSALFFALLLLIMLLLGLGAALADVFRRLSSPKWFSGRRGFYDLYLLSAATFFAVLGMVPGPGIMFFGGLFFVILFGIVFLSRLLGKAGAVSRGCGSG